MNGQDRKETSGRGPAEMPGAEKTAGSGAENTREMETPGAERAAQAAGGAAAARMPREKVRPGGENKGRAGAEKTAGSGAENTREKETPGAEKAAQAAGGAAAEPAGKAGPWAQPGKAEDPTRPADWQDRTLVLSDEAALKIYVNRQRMRLVELMTTLARPATAKMLSDRMGISASSVKHHLDKLVSIGVVEVDHREHIHGILATYYRVTDRTIVLDSTDPALRPFTEQIVQDNFGQLLQGALAALAAWQADPDASWEDAWGLMHSNGAIFLTREEANALRRQILDFLEEHKTPRPGAEPVRFGLVSYRVQED